MPVEAKPLFRPDVLRAHLTGFELPAHVDALRPKLAHWAELLASGKANTFKEQEILPDFLTDFFCELLGYTRPADGGPRYTISREKHVEVDGKFADAVLGNFGRGPDTRLIDTSQRQQATRHEIVDRLRVQHEIEKSSMKLRAPVELDCDAFVAEVKKVRGKKRPLSAAALKNLREEHARSIEPARALAAEALKLENEVSNLVNEAYGLTPDEVALLWQTAPPRMPIAGPASAENPGSASDT